jgi:hypothetical protein
LEEEGVSFGMRGKKNNVPKRMTEIEDFVKCVVWCFFHSFFAEEGTVPTIAKLLVKENIDFKRSS